MILIKTACALSKHPGILKTSLNISIIFLRTTKSQAILFNKLHFCLGIILSEITCISDSFQSFLPMIWEYRNV